MWQGALIGYGVGLSFLFGGWGDLEICGHIDGILFFQIVLCFKGNIRATFLAKLARPRGFEPLTF
jgi:hypothetical protein